MDYTINVQFLLYAYYLGHSGDSLGFVAVSLNPAKAYLIRQNYYIHSNKLSMKITKTAKKIMDEALEDEIIAQYSMDLGMAHTRERVFNSDGKIFRHLPRCRIQTGYNMG